MDIVYENWSLDICEEYFDRCKLLVNYLKKENVKFSIDQMKLIDAYFDMINLINSSGYNNQYKFELEILPFNDMYELEPARGSFKKNVDEIEIEGIEKISFATMGEMRFLRDISTKHVDKSDTSD